MSAHLLEYDTDLTDTRDDHGAAYVGGSAAIDARTTDMRPIVLQIESIRVEISATVVNAPGSHLPLLSTNGSSR
jgi:hypothetical protein